MEQLDQLKVMRDEARQRIAATADYKLATSLEALIADLEGMLGGSGKSEDDETTEEASDDEPARSEEADDSGADISPIASAFAGFQTSEEEVAEAAAEIEAAAAEREADREAEHEDEIVEQAESEEADLADELVSSLNGSGADHEEAHAMDETAPDSLQADDSAEPEEEAPIGVEDDFQQALEDLARSTATAPYDAEAEQPSEDEPSSPDELDEEELSEDEAIVRAMQALDEDLANVDLDVETGDSKEKAG